MTEVELIAQVRALLRKIERLLEKAERETTKELTALEAEKDTEK